MWGGCGHDYISQDRGQLLRVTSTVLRQEIVLKAWEVFIVVVIVIVIINCKWVYTL